MDPLLDIQEIGTLNMGVSKILGDIQKILVLLGKQILGLPIFRQTHMLKSKVQSLKVYLKNPDKKI